MCGQREDSESTGVLAIKHYDGLEHRIRADVNVRSHADIDKSAVGHVTQHDRYRSIGVSGSGSMAGKHLCPRDEREVCSKIGAPACSPGCQARVLSNLFLVSFVAQVERI